MQTKTVFKVYLPREMVVIGSNLVTKDFPAPLRLQMTKRPQYNRQSSALATEEIYFIDLFGRIKSSPWS